MATTDKPPARSAFPVVIESGENSPFYPELDRGMTLREYFAIKALAGLLANPAYAACGEMPAIDALHYADRLLKHLAKTDGK